ncbi:MAG: ABC transporter substrate-binding protein [Actinobacteria bacterium]|nr:ABC transporter substrate-binding protein [Actinomycetota bacterium]
MAAQRYERLLAIVTSFLLIVGVAAVAEGEIGARDFTPEIDDVAAPATEGPADVGSEGPVDTPSEAASPSPAPAGVSSPGPTTRRSPATTSGPDPQPTTATAGEQPTTQPSSQPTPTPTTQPPPPPPSPTPQWPSSGLYSADEARIGITDTTLRLCMHAAFLLGPVFDNRPEDEDVYWRWLNDQGGVHGRQVEITFTDDQYTAAGAAQAAAECDDRDPFLMLGGVGFDQTPTVRNYAETHGIPYVHTMAVEADPAKLDHSHTGSPTIEQVGRFVAQRVAAKHPNKRIGVIWVNSENWKAGRDSFLDELERLGKADNVTYDQDIPNNNEQFTPYIIDMRDKVDVLYFHANALAMARFFNEADQQGFYPHVIGEDGFNLVTDTAGQAMREFPSAEVVWITPAYDPSDTSTPYYDEVQRMQQAYAQYRPRKTPNDVDWMFWLAFKQIHRMLEDCGRQCDRNILTGMIQSGYSATVDPMCNVDFSRGGGHFGGHLVNLYSSVPKGDTSVWKQSATCVSRF